MKTDVHPQNGRPRWADWLVIGLFITLVGLPMLDCFTGIDVTRPPDENRLPAPWPRVELFDFSGLEKFLASTEAYFNDHFGFRKRLIRWSLQWKEGLFNDKSGHKVVVGKNGWLYTGELQMVDHFLGLARFTPKELKAWQTLLERRRDWLAARGIKYFFIVAPDKQDIYPEHLPDWLLAATPPQRETKLDQFLAYMRVHSTVPIVDLRPDLLAAKAAYPLYLVNDVHWNTLGGLIGGRTVIRALQAQLPALPTLALEDFIWSNAPAFGGDVAKYLGKNPPEKNFFTMTLRPAFPQPQLEELLPVDTVWGRHMFRTRVTNPAAPSVRAVFFHDSFALPWKPIFGHCFREALFLQERRLFDGQVVAEQRPDVVVNQMLERYFNTFDPRELMAQDNLP